MAATLLVSTHPASSPSLAEFRDQLRQEGALPAATTADSIMHLLQQVMVAQLPALALDPEEALDRFLQYTSLALVHQHLLVLRQGLKAPGLATRVDLTEGSLKTYRCNLNTFLDALQQHLKPATALTTPLLLPPWATLVEALRRSLPRKGPPLATAFLRFAQYCSARDLLPAQVTPDTIAQYRTWLAQESGLQTWDRYYRHLQRAWDLLVGLDLVHELAFAQPPGRQADFGLRWADLPLPVAEAFSLYARLATTDDPDERLEAAAIKNSTVELHRATYLDYMGFLRNVHGVDLATTPVPRLFDQEYLAAFHDFARQRAQSNAMAWHMRRLRFLRRLIDKVVSPRLGPVDTGWMDALFKKTTIRAHQKPLPAYSYTLIEQVLRHLETQITAAQTRGTLPRLQVPLYTAHFAITFLSDHHWRGINVRQTVLNLEVIREGQTFRFKTKNGQILNEDLSPQAHQVLLCYLNLREQAGIDSAALLVGKHGEPLRYPGFYRMIRKWFWEGAEVRFHPHAFRHLAVGESLQRNPSPALAGAVIGDRDARGVLGPYRKVSPSQIAQQWHDLNKAFREDRPQALPPPAQTLLQRAQHEPALLELLVQAAQDPEKGGTHCGSRRA